MPIEIFEAKPFWEKYLCDKCESGYMEYNPRLLTDQPKIGTYSHKCSNEKCTNTAVFLNKFPRIIWGTGEKLATEKE